MALSTQPYKGARDFYPEDKRLQKYMFAKWREVAERFGYEEYDAPILEPLDIYTAKSGEEIVNDQTYLFEDRGGRKVVIRPEMTPTVSRMVAGKRQELGYPLRWYSIPNLLRYERPQRGRLREHWQLNVDIFGVADTEAEYEIVSLVDSMFKSFGATRDMYEIRLNSRQLMDYALGTYLGLTPIEAHTVSKLIDRKQKMEASEFISKIDVACSPQTRANGNVEKLIGMLEITDLKKLPKELKAHPSVVQLQSMLKQLSEHGISNARFDITLMRGFDYYTDIVFEVFDKHPDNNRSMLGGGRYDGLVGLFGVEPVPTVGFGWGDVTLANFLELHQLMPKLESETEVYIAMVGDAIEAARKPIAALRDMKVNVAVDSTGRKLDKQIKTADKKGIPYVMVMGHNEIDSGQYSLKNLATGQEETHSLERIVTVIKDNRK